MSRIDRSTSTVAARSGRARSESRWIATALLALIVPTAFFGLIEAGTRRFVRVPNWAFPAPGACTRRDPMLGYSFLPSCVGRMAGTPVRTNALGLRGADVPDDGRRILAIGDSCTWGYQVREDESYPAVLGRLVDQRPGTDRYRVLNAGTPGYTSHHGLVYLRERGLGLHPSLVLIGFEWNDGLRMGDVARRLERIRRLRHVIALDDWLRSNSDFYRMVAYRVARRSFPALLGPQVTPSQYRANVTAMVGLAREHGAQAALIDWNAADAGYRNMLDDVSVELGVPLVRFYGPRIPGDVVHPTAEGYRRFVTILYARLRDAGYIDGA